MYRKVSFAFLLCILIVSANVIVILSSSFGNQVNLSMVEIHNPSEVDVSIGGNDDWINQGWPGNGSVISPFRIENKTLGRVRITHSTFHSTIRNCEITGEVSIWDTSNCTLENVVLNGNTDFELVSEIQINNATLNTMEEQVGIYFSQATNFTIRNCVITGSSDAGLYLDDCSFGLVQENSFSGTGHIIHVTQTAYTTPSPSYPAGAAIVLFSCSDITVTKNEIFSNVGFGIDAWQSLNISIISNSERQNYRGLRFFDSREIIVSDNILEGGVSFSNCNQNMLSNNSIGSNGLDLFGEEAFHFQIEEANNTVLGKPLLYMTDRDDESIVNGEFGQLIILNSRRIHFRGISVIGGSMSIRLRNCTEIVIESAVCSSIEILESTDCRIAKSQISDGSYAIYLDTTERCEIRDTYISNCQKGVYSRLSSNGTVIAHNVITEVRDTGIRFYEVNNARVENNTVSRCAETIVDTHWNIEYTQTAVILNSNNSLIVNNTIVGNYGHGINLSGENNTLFGNTIAGNFGVNARDDGINNQWDDGISLGNFWGDYWGFGYYYVIGSANSVDRFPIQAPGYEFSAFLATAIPITISSLIAISFVAVILYIIVRRRRLIVSKM